MFELSTLWFIAIAVLWCGYLLLEGFDLGVGMDMLVSARDEQSRRIMLNSISPVWDGNEVWLITAGAATFAAFPFWYASLFSTLYIPLTLLLLGLIFRAVGIEYRGKVDSDQEGAEPGQQVDHAVPHGGPHAMSRWRQREDGRPNLGDRTVSVASSP